MRKKERETRRYRETINRRGVDSVATNVTAATVSKPGVTSSRPAFEEKRGKERNRERERKREKSERKREKNREKRERASERAEKRKRKKEEERE